MSGWRSAAEHEHARRDVVELRVHGVGGAGATSLLGDPDPVRVAGDETSGFWRPRRPHDPARPHHHHEALTWGGNTSGTWRHALWVLLLPFALVNVAGWMHAPGQRRGRAVSAFGLTVTVSAVLLVATTAIDLVAVQCGGAPSCVADQPLLAPFGWTTPDGGDIFTDAAARRIAASSILPLLAVVTLWFAGRYKVDRLEGYDVEDGSTGDADAGLTDDAFWHGERPVRRARALHLTAGVSTVSAAVGWSAAPATTGAAAATLRLGAIIAVGIVVTAAVAVTHRELSARHRVARLDGGIDALATSAWAVIGLTIATAATIADPAALAVAAVVLAAGVASQAIPIRRWRRPALLLAIGGALGTLAGRGGRAIAVVFADDGLFAGLHQPVYEVVLLLAGAQVLLLVTIWRQRAQRSPRRDDRGELDDGEVAFDGRGALVSCSLALFLVVAIGNGIHVRLAQLLGRPVPLWDPASDPSAFAVPLAIPAWYETAALVLGSLVVSATITAITVRVTWRRRPSPFDAARASVAGVHLPTPEEAASEVERDAARRGVAAAHLTLDPVIANRIHPDDPRDRRRLDAVVAAGSTTALVAHADRLLARLVLGHIVLAVLILVVQSPLWPDGLPVLGRSAGPVATAALWLVGLLPLAAIVGLRALTGDRGARRQVGRLWDVVTFWPRHVHPIAPPCYGERVVPQLRRHLGVHLAAGHGVVLLGHSQGSVVAAAAVAAGVAGPTGPVGDRLHLVTVGTPLGILYERAFPAYFGADLFAAVAANVGSWHAMHCPTDVFGWPLFPPLHRSDPSTACHVCGFDRQGGHGAPRIRTADHVVVDPERWRTPTGEDPPPPILGHGAYLAYDAVVAPLTAAGSTPSEIPARLANQALASHVAFVADRCAGGDGVRA